MKTAVLLLAAAAIRLGAQSPDVNYDESRVPKYTLPNVLGGAKDRAGWEKERVRILDLYRREMFGRSPERPAKLAWEVGSVDPKALGGKASRKIVTIYFNGKSAAPRARMLMYLPPAAKKPVPLFLGLSFAPIQDVANDVGVPLGPEWIKGEKQPGQDKTRGTHAEQWQVEKILSHGFGLAVIYYGDIEPDFDGGMKYGVRPVFFKPGQSGPAADDWGAISAWAWGLSRAMDYLVTDHDIDASRVAVFGHSRLGKTAIWAGAQDPRFWLVISNESGEGGAAISRRDYGERTNDLNTRFPHWFCLNFRQFSGREDQMPFDSHMLLGLIAPRALYVASAEGDRWSDPRGEFLGAYHASRVWQVYGKKGLLSDAMPAVNQPVMGQSVAYHIRTGKHDVTAFDWDQYIKFAEMQ